MIASLASAALRAALMTAGTEIALRLQEQSRRRQAEIRSRRRAEQMHHAVCRRAEVLCAMFDDPPRIRSAILATMMEGRP